MIRLQLAAPTRALVAGTVCLAILGGMLVGHAWPLWTGRDVLIATSVVTTRTSAPGEYLQLSTAADILMVGVPGRRSPEGEGGPVPDAKVQRTAVRVIQPWVKDEPKPNARLDRSLRGKTIYVQLEPGTGGEFGPVSVSLAPVDGAVNLRGIVTWATGPGELRVQYGIDAFYMQEGHAKLVEQASRAKRHVQMQVVIAKSGRARIRNLFIDGAPVQ